jgi:hypothetical protein
VKRGDCGFVTKPEQGFAVALTLGGHVFEKQVVLYVKGDNWRLQPTEASNRGHSKFLIIRISQTEPQNPNSRTIDVGDLDHSGIGWNCWTGGLAHLGIARANALQSDCTQ